MPVSDAWGKGWVRDQVLDVFSDRLSGYVTDVGAGYGAYSDLLRQDLNGFYWTAVEVWEPYIDKISEKYDLVIVSDILDTPEYVQASDLVIFGDVLEHMSHENALWLLGQVDPTAVVVVCVPMLHLEQGPVNGNPYEVHSLVNQWTDAGMTAAMVGIAAGRRLVKHVGDVVAYYVLVPTRGETHEPTDEACQ